MRKHVKKIFVSGCFAAAMLSMGLAAGAQEEELVPGVTVTEDAESPTGYTATFVYEAADAKKVTVAGAFAFYNDEKELRGVTPETFFSPYEWENGMFEAGDEAYQEEMTKVDGTDYWSLSLPLPSGHYQYVFHVDDSEEGLEDPTNPMEASGVENGNKYGRSTFDVPYDAEKQSKSIDFSYTATRTDGQAGTVSYMNYTDCFGDERPLGVYLPYGYDAEREEPYKVLYMSHGGGGNEIDWFAGANVDAIFDNLAVAGTVEPTVIVTCDNNPYMDGFNVSENLVKNLTECIVPYVEENYNVAKDASGKAYCGLSMGGMITSNILYNCSDSFGYFGIFSAADTNLDFSKAEMDQENMPSILLGGGIYDFGLVKPEGSEPDLTIRTLQKTFEELDIPHGYSEAYGSHDWNTWMQLIKVFAEEYLWK